MSKIYSQGNLNYRLVYRFFIILVVLTSLFAKRASCSSINLFLKQAPIQVQREVKKELASEGEIKSENNGFQELLPKLSGFIALYKGYVDYSDKDGTIVFPRQQEPSKITLVITPKIDLETIEGNTIAFKKFVDSQPATCYLFEQREDVSKEEEKAEKTDDKAPKQEPSYYWRVTEQQKPDDGKIETLSIVLLTNPNNIVVPTGDFMSSKTQNLVLPDIHVVGNNDQAQVSLDFLDQKRFFEPIKRNEKIEKDKNISQDIIGNQP